MLQVVSTRNVFMTRGIACCLRGMMLLSEIRKKHMMLLRFALGMLGTHLKNGLVRIALRLLLLESPLVSRVYESTILSTLEKWCTCPGRYSLRRSPARVIVERFLQKRSVREVQRPLQWCPSVDLSLTMSQLCCPTDGGVL